MTIKTQIDISSIPIDMDRYENRIRTFSKWQGPVPKSHLASTGFYYSGIGDIVVCYCCKLQLKGWKKNDTPVEEHLRFEKDCDALPLFGYSADVDYMTNTKTLYPKYKKLSSRIKSFKKYPVTSKIRRKTFAEAGFFYPGVDDCTICFQCGIAVKEWDMKEDPWIQHAVFFPYCLQVKHLADNPETQKQRCLNTSVKSITSEELADIKHKAGIE